ncbi:flagellar export chaperone FliS [Undibacterium sp. RuRC25W]|uniref:flagellar export chaperone FliS n=1 Tax=Undibacterium sp. RuRC25W TaxID=3413047 RepID=UPI003BEF68B8
MFGSSKLYGANAYTKIGQETGVMAADPHKLIVMLFDGAIIAIGNAIQQMKNKEIASKGKSISHAISIIDNGLRASLDKEAGGDIAKNLDALYEYMSRELLLANAGNKEEKLIEVQTLLRDLKETWEAINPAPGIAAAAANKVPSTASYDPLQPKQIHAFEA